MLAVMMAIWRVCPHFIEVTALLNSRQIAPFEQRSPSLPSSEHHHQLDHLNHQHDGHVHVVMVIVRIMTV